jgi:hypothetical protein
MRVDRRKRNDGWQGNMTVVQYDTHRSVFEGTVQEREESEICTAIGGIFSGDVVGGKVAETIV